MFLSHIWTCSEFTPDAQRLLLRRLREPYGVLRIEPSLTACVASALTTVTIALVHTFHFFKK